METKRRSLAKALSWRFLATLITMVVSFVITKELAFALEIGLLDTSIKFFTYFGHERLWLRINYGIVKTNDTDYQI